jgi:hypothetical protein
MAVDDVLIDRGHRPGAAATGRTAVRRGAGAQPLPLPHSEPRRVSRPSECQRAASREWGRGKGSKSGAMRAPCTPTLAPRKDLRRSCSNGLPVPARIPDGIGDGTVMPDLPSREDRVRPFHTNTRSVCGGSSRARRLRPRRTSTAWRQPSRSSPCAARRGGERSGRSRER